MPNPKDITDPTTAMNMALALMAKAFKLNYSTPTNNNQRISSNPRNRQIAQPGMNMGQDRQMQMVGGNGGNQFRQYIGQNAENPAGYNDVIGNHTQLLIAQKEEVGIQLQAEEYDLMAAAEAAKFVEDFKSLANEADASLAKHKELELEIKRLLKAVVSQDIMIIVQNESVVHTSDLQTELEPYKDMHQKIEWLQARLGDLKVKSKDTSSVSDTQNPLSQKLENENVELEFQLFKKISDQKDNTLVTSENTKFAKQPIVENLCKVGKVIAPGMFSINPSKTSRDEKHMPNTVSASARTKPLTVSQPLVTTKKDVNSDLNGLSSTGVDNTKTRRPQPRRNTKNDRVPSASKSSRSQNKEAEVEEHHRNLLLSKNNKHISLA
nr:hypothetical protein [Tanacetum cinerariifolium]